MESTKLLYPHVLSLKPQRAENFVHNSGFIHAVASRLTSGELGTTGEPML